MKQIGLASATAVGLGAIIGAGIFVLSGTAINLAGTGALLAFIITGAIALMYSIQLGELSSEMPHEHGGTYSFIYKSFGSELGFITGSLTYMAYMTSLSAIATGFGAYMVQFLGLSQSYSLLISIILIVALTLINLRGIKSAAHFDLGLVVFKVIVLIILILFALHVGNWHASNFSGFFNKGFGGIFAASVIALFAYTGFQSIASITPNIKGGGKTAAKAILLAAVISMVLYISVTASMLALVPASQFPISANPLDFVLQHSLAPQWLVVLVGLGALVATASASLSMLIGGSRMLNQIAIDGLLPKQLREMNSKHTSPTNALYATSILSILMLFSGNIYTIAAISNFGTIFGYMMVCFAVLKLRKLSTDPKDHQRSLKNLYIEKRNVVYTPFYPWLSLFSLIATIFLFYGFKAYVLSSGIIIFFASLIIYEILREIKDKPVIRIRFFK